MAHYKVIIYLRTHSYHASIVIDVTLKTQKKEKHKLGGLSPCGKHKHLAHTSRPTEWPKSLPRVLIYAYFISRTSLFHH